MLVQVLHCREEHAPVLLCIVRRKCEKAMTGKKFSMIVYLVMGTQINGGMFV